MGNDESKPEEVLMVTSFFRVGNVFLFVECQMLNIIPVLVHKMIMVMVWCYEPQEILEHIPTLSSLDHYY